MHLMFDPTVSLHYDVLCFPNVPERPTPPYQSPKRHCKEGSSWTRVYTVRDFEKLPPSLKTEYRDEVNALGCMEWPPHLYAVQVFSSRTGQWQERHFIRQGNAAVTVADVWSDQHARHGPSALRRNVVYWRGAFYLHCYVDFIVRLSLQDGKYAVIKTPTCDQKSNGYFGKSKQRIYYTAVIGYQISVWVLQEASETCQTLQWALRHQNDLEHDFQQHYNRHLIGDEIGKSWTLDPCMEESSDKGDNRWDSSDDSVTDALEEGINGNEGYKNCYYGMDFLGYHPEREIVFLGSHYSGFAYYLALPLFDKPTSGKIKSCQKLATSCEKQQQQQQQQQSKLPTKQEDAFEPTIEIEIGLNKFSALCDLGASVSTIPKSVYDSINLGPYANIEIILNMPNSTFTQVVGIQHGVIAQIND
uniref:Uncharacterized protein n=1 Tax=Aegilops tauschii TaxID=37682 RepID=M8BI00_AEGTA